MVIDCNDNVDESSIYDEEVVICRDPDTNEVVKTTFCEMRGIVDNYSNPISSTLAKLYEALLVRVFRDINMEILQDVRTFMKGQRNQALDDGYFEMVERYERLSSTSSNESIADKLERTLFDIQDKTVDYIIIYEDLSNITKMDVSILANFCSDMAEIETEYLFADLNYPERMEKFAQTVNEYTDKMSRHLSAYNITVANFPYNDAKMYLKCVY